MGCIKVTSQVPDRCISVTSQVPDYFIRVTSTEQNGECNIPIPVPNWELKDSGYGDVEYDNYGNEIIYENKDIKINITNLSYIVDIGLKYTIGVGGGEIVSIDEHSGIVVWHTPSITNGSWTTEEISFSVTYSDDCGRYSNRTYAYNIGAKYDYALIHHNFGGSGFIPFPTKDTIDGKQAFVPHRINEAGSNTNLLANIIYLFNNNDKVKQYFRSSVGYLSEDAYKLNGCNDGRYCYNVLSINIDKKVGHLTGGSSYVYYWNIFDSSPTPHLLLHTPTFIELQGSTYIARPYVRFPDTPSSRQFTVKGQDFTIHNPQCLNSIKIMYNGSEVSFYYNSDTSSSVTIRFNNSLDGTVTVISPRPEDASKVVQNNAHIDATYCT